MTQWQYLKKIAHEAPGSQVAIITCLMLVGSLTEGIGLMMLVPILSLLESNQNASPNGTITTLAIKSFAWLGMPFTTYTVLPLFVLAVVFRGLVSYYRSLFSSKLQYFVVDRLRLRCFDALLYTDWRWQAHRRQTDHSSMLLANINRLGVSLSQILSVSVSLVTAVTFMVAAFVLSWQMSMLAISSGILIVGLIYKKRRASMLLGIGMSQSNRSLQATVFEGLASIRLTKILNAEQRHYDRFKDAVDTMRHQQISMQLISSQSNNWMQAGSAVLLVSYVLLGILKFHTPMTTLLTLVVIFSRLIPILNSLNMSYQQWLQGLPAIRETFELLSQCEIHAEARPRQDVKPMRFQHTIELRNLSIRYEGRPIPALDDIQLTIKARSTTALIGPSGAGKSTLADVLMGLLWPDQGTVLIDGQPLTPEQIPEWRRSIAYVPQETFMFHDSVRNNLLWAKPDATERELLDVLDKASAGFVLELPSGLDTIVGDGGVLLSGGERQRLGLARALLRVPSLLILDEATSALDLANEVKVRRAIERLHGDLTVVIIGHRLPTLEHADLVVALDQGRIDIQGSWEQVRQDSRYFKHLRSLEQCA